MWYDGIEDAARTYFYENDIDGMFNILKPLHLALKTNRESMNDTSFNQIYAAKLTEAEKNCELYMKTSRKYFLDRAWSLYYAIYLELKNSIFSMKSLTLEYSGPRLLNAKNLELAIPGLYHYENHENDVNKH